MVDRGGRPGADDAGRRRADRDVTGRRAAAPCRAVDCRSTLLRGSEGQRRDLLAGVLDRAGSVSARGCVRLPALPAGLAADLHDLVVGLGFQCSATGSAEATALSFCADDDVFRVESKRLAHKELRGQREDDARRVIVDVRRVASVPVRCVEVDNADHLYLAGRSMVPTHNSTLGLDIARSSAIKNNMATCIFSLEMSRNEITMRLLSAEARVPLHHMRTGRLTDDDWTRLARRMGEVSNAPLFIDDSPNMSMMEIRAKCRRLKQRHDLKLVIIDYLQLMSSGKRVESRQQEVSEFSRAIKLLAKELEVPVIAISQLNRGSEQRTDKKPQMSDLRESGSHRTGCGHGGAAAPRGALRAGVTSRRRGGLHRGQAPQRPDRHHHRRVPGPLLPVRRHGAELTAPNCRQIVAIPRP